MWYIRTYRPSYSYIILFSILLIISIYLTFYDNKISQLFINQLQPNSINKTNKINNVSTNYLRVRLDLKTNTAICHIDDNLIIYILSTVTNFERRKIIRSTWASPLIKTCFVFILGQPQNSDSIQLLVNNEKRQYKDIIQIDHIESYANVIYKEVAALQWAYHFYPSIPYLFKTDDDLIIDSILISDIAQLLVTNSPNNASYILKYRPKLVSELLASDRSTFFRGAWSMDFQTTLRAGKFAVSRSVWPHSVLPLYCSGFGWLMSKTIRNKLVNASYIYPSDQIVWIGDVFLSGFLAKTANVKCTGISIDYEQTSSANCSCLMIQRPMLTVCSSTFHAGGSSNDQSSYNEYKKAWNVIQQRHNLINRTITDIKDC